MISTAWDRHWHGYRGLYGSIERAKNDEVQGLIEGIISNAK